MVVIAAVIRLKEAPMKKVVLGIIALVQPWYLMLHSYGVTITLIGLVGFSVFSHFKPGPKGE